MIPANGKAYCIILLITSPGVSKQFPVGHLTAPGATYAVGNGPHIDDPGVINEVGVGLPAAAGDKFGITFLPTSIHCAIRFEGIFIEERTILTQQSDMRSYNLKLLQ